MFSIRFITARRFSDPLTAAAILGVSSALLLALVSTTAHAATGWEVELKHSAQGRSCTLASPVFDDGGNRLRVVSLDGHMLWVANIYLLEDSDLSVYHGRTVEFSVDGKVIASGSASTSDGVQKIGFEASLIESTYLIHSMFRGNRLTVQGSGISGPFNISLIGFTAAARDFAECVSENMPFNHRMNELLIARDPVWAATTQQVLSESL